LSYQAKCRSSETGYAPPPDATVFLGTAPEHHPSEVALPEREMREAALTTSHPLPDSRMYPIVTEQASRAGPSIANRALAINPLDDFRANAPRSLANVDSPKP